MPAEPAPWSDLIPSIAKPAVYAYKYRKLIQEYWKRAQVKVGLGAPDIIVTGRSGTGKSVLASHFHGEANSLDWAEPGTSPDVEIKPITIGDWTKIVHVIPGQNNSERARSLDLALNKTEGLSGIIHVVDWGYTAIRDNVIRSEMVEREGISSIDELRNRNLSLELEDFESMLDKISMSIANGRGPKWIVLAVNKIDLYECVMDEAKKYYHPQCEGKFSKKINTLYQIVGKNNIKIHCIPVCSMPEPFHWNNESVSSQIDSVTRQRNYLRLFIDQIAQLQNGINS